MKITLKHRDAAFAMTPLREANSLTDLVLLKQLKDGLENYAASALVTIEIEKEKMFELYTRMSGLREGHSARFADSIMTSDGAYKSLFEQISEGAMAGNEDFIWLAQKVTEWRTNFEIMGQQDIDANLSFLQNLPI
jgi:hypothetical protein